jgi:dihydroflavonol-4-reductase
VPTPRLGHPEKATDFKVVFHIAGWYELGLPPSAGERMERINVGGTENVLGLAVELGVPKIVYTSTAWVLGDTHGAVVDETYQRDVPFQSAYDRTKYQAHQVAERYIYLAGAGRRRVRSRSPLAPTAT